MIFELRPYQVKALDDIKDLYLRGAKKVLLHLQGGGGKTVIFCQVLKGAHLKGKKGLMVVNRVDLVEQASRRLHAEGVPHGKILAGSAFEPDHNIYVASIQTYARRDTSWEWDFIVIDEAHFSGAPQYVNLAVNNPRAFYLAVTATPYQKTPIRHVAEAVVSPITTKELYELGYLVKPRYFVGKVAPDLENAKINRLTDDYERGDALAAMMNKKLIGDIVECYRELADRRPGVLFAVDVDHSKFLAEHLNANGIRALHLDASHSTDTRRKAIQSLHDGELDLICNCELFTTGVDIPCASVIILARPTQSLNLYIQMVCRGTRPSPGKADFIVIDHARNVLSHGFICRERPALLDGYGKKKPDAPPITTCLRCYAVYDPTVYVRCPSCGDSLVGTDDVETSRGSPVTVSGEMVELLYEADKVDDLPSTRDVGLFLAYLFGIKEARDFKPGWLYHRLKTFFGADTYGKEATKMWGGLIAKSDALSFSQCLALLLKSIPERESLEECYRRGHYLIGDDPTRRFNWIQRHLGNNRTHWDYIVRRGENRDGATVGRTVRLSKNDRGSGGNIPRDSVNRPAQDVPEPHPDSFDSSMAYGRATYEYLKQKARRK